MNVKTFVIMLVLDFIIVYNRNMDKQFQEVKNFITNLKNRTTVIAVGAGFVVAGIIAMFTTKRGKAKR